MHKNDVVTPCPNLVPQLLLLRELDASGVRVLPRFDDLRARLPESI